MVMEVTTASAVSRDEVDTSRPFQSVREAVEVFGVRYAGGGSSSNASSESSVKLSAPPAASSMMMDCLKKLEADLAEAKGELVQLRQRQSQMVVAVSSLSVQFNKGLPVFSGLNKGKEVVAVGAPVTGEEDDGNGQVRSDRWDESRAEEWMANLEYLPSLSEALTIKMIKNDLGERKERKVRSKKAGRKKHKKQKSGISLVGGIFSKKSKSR
uniref:Uncharacterized protein n=1 Tax=Arundo donax TaxID=35708 RepID=A0A0A9HA10_ARUDO